MNRDRAADYCATRARWWRGEIPTMPDTPGVIVAQAQAAYALECDADPGPPDTGDSSAKIAALWVRAADRILSGQR